MLKYFIFKSHIYIYVKVFGKVRGLKFQSVWKSEN
jgi:hypothetical protein